MVTIIKRGQTKPDITRSLVERRGGDISQFSEESVRRAVESGRITIVETQARATEEFPAFESEELQMTVAGKSDIERARGQSITRAAFLRDFGRVRGISSPDISTPQGPGRIVRTPEGRQIFVPAGTPVELQRTTEGFTKSFAGGGLVDVTTPPSFSAFTQAPSLTTKEIREKAFVFAQAGERRAELFFSGGKETGFRGFAGGVLALPVTIPSQAFRSTITLADIFEKKRGREFSPFIQEQKLRTLGGTGIDIALIGFGGPILRGIGRGVRAVTPAPIKVLVGRGIEKGINIADITVERLRIPRGRFFTQQKIVGGVKPPELVETVPSLSKVFPDIGLVVEERAVSTVAGKAIVQTRFGSETLQLGFKIGKPQVAVFGGTPAKGTGVITEVVSKDLAVAQETFILARPTRKGIEKIGIQARSIIARQEPGVKGRLSLRRFGFTEAEATKTLSLGKAFSKGKVISGSASFGTNIKVLSAPQADIFASRTQDIILKPSGKIRGRGISKQVLIQLKPQEPPIKPFKIEKFTGKGLKEIELSKSVLKIQPLSKTSQALITEQLKAPIVRLPRIPITRTSVSTRVPTKTRPQPSVLQRGVELEKISLKLATAPVQKTAAREAVIGLFKPKQARATAQLPKQLTGQLPLQITAQVPSSAQLVKQIQLQVPKQITAQARARASVFNIPGRLDLPIPRLTIPIIPLFGRFGEGKLTRGPGVLRPTKFRASLVGLLSGVISTAPIPKRLTGIEIRLPRIGGVKSGKKKKKRK
ncbi:hypothetical protein LCGC14_0534510 [marine sediment metagenome]|uniref:Uncharacterized protein n=1 Tax=marine sediment metagenome TaxID=412755 RepID=A0A0F9RUL8_9ZZZZ